MIFNKTRISKHKESVITYLMKLDSECRDLRFQLNEFNKDQIVKSLINKTELQRKYRRYYKVLNI